MKRILSIILSIPLIFSSLNTFAGEGMWLLSMIGKNYEEMKEQGFRLTPEDIYNVNQACIKDAIVGLGNEGRPFSHFCTAGIVSDKGLIFTNHHCGYEMIQAHSTVEHDYLRNGFWASSLDEELPNEGTTASIMVRMEDVTAKVLNDVTEEMTENERTKAINKVADELVKEVEKDSNYKARVVDMFDNNQYFLFVHIIYKDVRLVGAPPENIGKFGGDTDNWSWPRHTGDFSIFRIYTAPDGTPASYNEENVPLKPKYHLPISINGIEEGDFSMVMGFPGGTDRYMTSYGLKETMEVVNKWRYNIRSIKLDILRKDMKKDPKIKLQYASKYARSSNYWKYSYEQNIALRKLNTMGQKQAMETKFQEWAEKLQSKKYMDVLDTIEVVYERRREDALARQFLLEALLIGPDLPVFSFQSISFLHQLKNEDLSDEERQKAIKKFKENAREFYKNYNPNTERKLIAALFDYFADNIDRKYYPGVFAEVYDKYDGNFEEYTEDIFTKSFFNPKSIFADEESMMDFLDDPKAKTLEKDPIYKMGTSILSMYRNVSGEMNEKSKSLEQARRYFVQGVMEINKDFQFYPDANSTIRLTYGNCMGYEPRDGVVYDYYTTLDGVMAKANPEDMEFDLPSHMYELYKDKKFGQYTNKKGELPVCFITDNDITGGNSGSPVMDAKGNLIGLAFDGNTEAMSGDIEFEEDLQRCIIVDIRYVLWLIDIYADADNLLDELSIVKK
ncbi:MAG: S46 family peptidase [Bacteroidales bacterium]